MRSQMIVKSNIFDKINNYNFNLDEARMIRATRQKRFTVLVKKNAQRSIRSWREKKNGQKRDRITPER